jgi:hypothetical protein
LPAATVNVKVPSEPVALSCQSGPSSSTSASAVS